jgi:hypothetical protein
MWGEATLAGRVAAVGPRGQVKLEGHPRWLRWSSTYPGPPPDVRPGQHVTLTVKLGLWITSAEVAGWSPRVDVDGDRGDHPRAVARARGRIGARPRGTW